MDNRCGTKPKNGWPNMIQRSFSPDVSRPAWQDAAKSRSPSPVSMAEDEGDLESTRDDQVWNDSKSIAYIPEPAMTWEVPNYPRYITYAQVENAAKQYLEDEPTETPIPLSKAQRKRRNKKRNRAARQSFAEEPLTETSAGTSSENSGSADFPSTHGTGDQDEVEMLYVNPRSGVLHGLYGARTNFHSTLNLVMNEHFTYVKPSTSQKTRERIQGGRATLTQANIVCGCCNKLVAICGDCGLPMKGTMQDGWHTCKKCFKPIAPERQVVPEAGDHSVPFSESPFIQGMVAAALDERSAQRDGDPEPGSGVTSVWSRIRRLQSIKE